MAQIAATAIQQLAPAQLELGMDDSSPSTGQGAGHSALGFELGWDHAHHGLTPPVEHLFSTSPLRQGWQAGQATFGRRTLKAHRHTQLWLQLRTHAWARGRSFETTLLTPNYLQQLDTEHCPITRVALSQDRQNPNAYSIDRVRNDAGYAAGNLAVMSQQANAVKAGHGWAAASEIARSVEQGPFRQIGGLGAAPWQRIAVLCSFVTELPHEEAATIPLHVLPPNRLRLFNPIQALQALVTRQLATPGWSARLARLEALLPSDALRADFNRFVLALAPRVLQAQQLIKMHEIRWALEDAWGHELVQKRWAKFALQLTAAQAEALVQRAAAKRLSPVHVQQHGQQLATEGWALERGGYRAAA
ncbi:hypothetical protein RQP53_20125 [Paucibacter sp. APW11]|uniref:Uncharacterized protein n=1 Tax=Roseateles aquae TaxID=3077235 RepID=A0ABU3PGT2_9BURK|nr:hypothetical protein [Paucibacter sp. APW11]MDT9001595.1 hypothetical protein [Paucibacter sp. APW11]